MHTLKTEIERIQSNKIYGRVTGIQGLLVEVAGAQRNMSIGSRVNILSRSEQIIPCEVVGFKSDRALLMPYSMLEGVGVGCKAFIESDTAHVHPCEAWLGRVVNAMGEPIDGKGPIKLGPVAYPVRNSPPPAHLRGRVKGKMDLGVRSINTFLTCCNGQRMGIFAGSGVGKSILLSMFAKYTASDITVIGLIGERGREVQEFLEDDLGEEGLKRSVVVVATSDETALMRRQAAYLTLTVCEYFRDLGKDVLCLMDSVTRFAMAQREIGLAESIIRTGKLSVNLDKKTVEIDGQRVHLTGKEYAMLELLSLRKTTTLTKEMFLNHLYGGMDEPELKIIDVFICKLRKKLASISGENYIETVWGRGYVLRDPEEDSSTIAVAG